MLFVHLRQSLVHNFQNSYEQLLTSYMPILCHVFAANWLLGTQNAFKKKSVSLLFGFLGQSEKPREPGPA